jgi:mRNA-degrading endonuclease RelE of RelBE toxin-antitoxin system
MFAIKIKRKALRKIAKLSEKQKQNIKTVILILKTDPIPFKKPMSANLWVENL